MENTEMEMKEEILRQLQADQEELSILLLLLWIALTEYGLLYLEVLEALEVADHLNHMTVLQLQLDLLKEVLLQMVALDVVNDVKKVF